MHARERRMATLDDNRHVRAFAWGTEYLEPVARAIGVETVSGYASPSEFVAAFSANAVRHSDDFFHAPLITDYQLASDKVLTWTSAVETVSAENNCVRASFFQARHEPHRKQKRAVIILPQWNAQPDSHIALAKLINRFGISALRLTLPYHEERRPAELERAEHLVSSNIGRTIESVRQAVLDARAGVAWLRGQGYTRIGIIGTSIGSCAAFLTFAHEPLLQVGVFNHVSGYFADVVWNGISTRHVREGIERQLTLEQTRRCWLPISPQAYIEKLKRPPARPVRFIAARYDLTFPADLSRDIINELRRAGVPINVAWLPCGHYTLGETPWKYLDGYKIINFFRRHL